MGIKMALFDMFDEISERQITRTETGDERIIGVAVGIVTENYDKDMPGKLCISIPVRDKEANTLKWIKNTAPYSGNSWGQYFLPEVGDQVLLAFEYGNIEKPYVIGAIPKDNDRFLTSSFDEHNQFKRIVTKYGNEIVFEDHKEGEGEKDKITISTSKQSHKILMDNENKKIIVSDKENNCRVEMLTEKGEVKLNAAKKLKITVGDGIKINMDGESGAISIKAKKVSIEASESLNLKTDGTANLAGKQTIAEAADELKLKSNGAVSIAGTPIKIG